MPLVACWRLPLPPSLQCRCFSSSLSTAPYWSPESPSARPMSWWPMPSLQLSLALAVRMKIITKTKAMTSMDTSPAISMILRKGVSAAPAQLDLLPSAEPLNAVEACALSEAALKAPLRVVPLIPQSPPLRRRRTKQPVPLARQRVAAFSPCPLRRRSQFRAILRIPMRFQS